MALLDNINMIGTLAFIKWKNTVTQEIREVAATAVQPIIDEPLYYAERMKSSFNLPDPQEDWVFHSSWTEDRFNTLSGRMTVGSIWKSDDGKEVWIMFPNGRQTLLDDSNHVWTSKPNKRISMVHKVYTVVDDDLTQNVGHDWDTEDLEESNKP